jgi:translation initiation factor 3 subunit M
MAGKTEQIGAIFTDLENVKSQFTQCPPSTEQMQKLLRQLHEVLLTCKKSEEASQVNLILI